MEFIWDQEVKFNPGLEHIIMAKLSPSLRDEVYAETYLKYLKSVNLFNKYFSLSSLMKMAQAMTKIFYLPKEKIYTVSKKMSEFIIITFFLYYFKTSNKEDPDLYMIIDGMVDLLSERDGSITTLGHYKHVYIYI